MKINGKRNARESCSSDSSFSDANQNKKSKDEHLETYSDGKLWPIQDGQENATNVQDAYCGQTEAGMAKQ